MEEEQYDVLVCDINNIFVQQYIGNDYRKNDGTDLSGVYGTLKMLQYQIYRFNPTFVICVFDGKGGSLRKRKIFPEYKANRGMPVKVNYTLNMKQTKETILKGQKNFIYQLKLLHEFLKYLPVHRVVAPGYEADELIGYIVKNYYEDMNKLIISNDKDFHQLVSEDVHIYDQKARVVKDLAKVKEIWGTSNTKLLTVLRAIDGDKSDKIDGIDGLKLKGIQKYFPDLFERSDIQSVTGLTNYLSHIVESCHSQKKAFASNYQTIEKKAQHLLTGKNEDGKSCMSIIERNYELMQLFDPKVKLETALQVRRYMDAKVSFDSSEYKMKIMQEELRMEGTSTDAWETQYRNLQYNQAKYYREQAKLEQTHDTQLLTEAAQRDAQHT